MKYSKGLFAENINESVYLRWDVAPSLAPVLVSHLWGIRSIGDTIRFCHLWLVFFVVIIIDQSYVL